MQDPRTMAQAIVNTIPEPFVVLDDQLCIIAASRPFCTAYGLAMDDAPGRPLSSLGGGQWDIAALHALLEKIIPDHTVIDGFEIEYDFPDRGRRTILVTARQMSDELGINTKIFLVCTDITARRSIEQEKDQLLRQTEELLRQKDVLLQELQHRVANSLQIIASILLLKARVVSSEETRQHLQDAHQRVLSVAEIQRHLHASEGINKVEVSSYLTKLCGSLASSMIGENQPITVKVISDAGMIGSDQAVSVGLIVTELVINAIKYAFPSLKTDAVILVTYEINGADWRLIVADNGVGITRHVGHSRSGLGTVIVQALVKQLDAVMEVPRGTEGLKISISRARFASPTPSGV